MTDKEIEIENKRYELAEQEYKNMDGAEIIDFLFNKIYAKMSDNAVLKLWDDLHPDD